MSDIMFNSFIKSVYGSGSAMHLFDSHIDGGMEVIGGVNDITVNSIFGGDESDSSDDSEKSNDSDSSDSETEDNPSFLASVEILIPISEKQTTIKNPILQPMNIKPQKKDNPPPELARGAGLSAQNVAALLTNYR